MAFAALALLLVTVSSTLLQSTCQTLQNKTDAEPVSRPASMSMMMEEQSSFRPTPVPDESALKKQMDDKEKEVEVKGRALNFTMSDSQTANALANTTKHHFDDFPDLSDVEIKDNEEEEEHEMLSKILASPETHSVNISKGICEKGGLTYEPGEKLEIGCDSICTCTNGRMDCTDRCSTPYFRKGKKIEDPLCSAKATEDKCCAILVCAGDTETEPLEICSYNNKTYNRGDTFNKGCSEVCSCEIAGKIACKPRCPTTNGTSDRCVEVPDPNDPCCKKTLCDVTLADHEDKEHSHKITSARFLNDSTIMVRFEPSLSNDSLPILDVSSDNITWKSYQVQADGLLLVQDKPKYIKIDGYDDIIKIEELTPTVEISIDNKKNQTKTHKCLYKDKEFDLNQEFNDNCESLCVCKVTGMKCLKLECPTYFGVDVLNPTCVEWETVPPNFKPNYPTCCPDQLRCKNNGSCMYQQVLYKNWEQIPVNVTGCDKRCYCEMGKVECQNTCPPVTALPPPNLQCPPHTARLDHVPDDDCCLYWVCPPEVKTVKKPEPTKILGPLVIYGNSDNKTKTKLPPDENPYYQAEKNKEHELLKIINNHPELSNYPSGSVLEIHHGVPVVPFVLGQGVNGGNKLPLPEGVTIEDILEEINKNSHPHNTLIPYTPQLGGLGLRPNLTIPGHGFPNGFPNMHGFPPSQNDVNVHILEAIDSHTVRLVFMVPAVIVGLHGRVEVRYTHKDDEDLDSWELQVFAPPNDLIATPQLEFDLLGLKADTEYKIKITITLRDLQNIHSSRIYKVRTLKEVTTTLPPMIPIQPDLVISDINATWIIVVWRKFTEYELQFIDGVQLRFKELDGKLYAATPLIHRAVTSYTLENLKPNTKYELGIFFIPFPGQQTELHSENMVHFTTASQIDTYGFNVTLEIAQIKSQSVEISWSGVPYPEDKYVNIYRAIYQSDSGKEDQSTFKIAKRDSPTKSVIMDLKPGTRYRLWLEVYLTNGKIKTSNVQDFITKPRAAPNLGSSSHQDKLSRNEQLDSKGDYYGPLVIVAILASIAILSTLVLLLILVRRHNQNKAAITPPSNRVSQSAYDNPTYKVEIQQETMGL